MAADDNLQFVIKVRGGPAAASDVRGLTKELDRLTTTTGRATVTTRQMGQESKKTHSAFAGAITSTLRYATAYGALRVAGMAFMSGFRFDATMEQNTVAFTHFLGSAQAAKQELSTLFDIAAHTPFEMKDVTTATRRFLAFGFSVQQANEELRIAGDAIAGAGLGAQGMDQLVRALGQIQAKGRLQGDELLQLSELGIIGPQMIAKQMGMTQVAFQKATTAGKISSEEAIKAINAVLTTQFKGSAAEQSRTLVGQLSTAKDYGSQAAGALVQPLVDLVKSSILPTISQHFQNWSKWLGDQGGAQRLYVTLSHIAKILGPVAAGFAVFKSLGWLAALVTGLGAAGGFLAGIWGVLTSVVSLLASAGTWSEVLYVLWGGIQGAAEVLAVAIGGVLGVILAVVAVVAVLYWKVGFVRDAINAVAKGVWWLFSGIGKFLGSVVVRWADIAWSALNRLWGLIKAITGGIQSVVTVAGKIGTAITGGGIHFPHIPFMASGGNIRMGGSAIVGEAGPELAENRGGHTKITPLTTPGARAAHRVLQPLYLQVDGRVFAEVMVDVSQTDAARR